MAGGNASDHVAGKSGHGIIIDDCDRMLEETQTDEERHTRLEYGLFRVLNAAIQNTTPLLLCTRCAPAQWPVRLRDLHSRLQLAVPVVMMRPDDAFLHAFLHRQCELRGLYIPENVLVYMLSRLERSCASVLEALQLLDYHTASRKRRLTIPLVCEILFGKNSAP
ncbi:MAG: DnaA/Hda family protein [Pseudomonadota bacterium]